MFVTFIEFSHRPYKIPAEGIWLYLMYAPSIAICLYVIVSSGIMELVVAGILLAVGALILYGVHVAKEQSPDIFTGACF
jgi:hypothetical protein